MCSVEKFDPVKQMRTHPALINRRSNRLTIEQLKSTHLELDEQQINVVEVLSRRRASLFLSLLFLEIAKDEKEEVRGTATTHRPREEITASGIRHGRQTVVESNERPVADRLKSRLFFSF